VSLTEHRRAFLETVDVSWALASRPEVAEAWTRESSCAGMTVGGLAHHLLGQAVNTARFLDTPPGDQEPIALLQHYEQASWVSESRSGRTDPEQNDVDNTAAAAGRDAVLAEARTAVDLLPTLLEQPRVPDTVHITWQGWSLATDDFLTTRMMEMLVHGDDLATSVGLETPTYPDAAAAAVVGLLSGVALRRHGATALVRALSRPQRAPETVSAF
jgi:hypothetical protein